MNVYVCHVLRTFFFIILSVSTIYPQKSHPKQHSSEIVFGQSAVFTGAFKIYGEMIKNAINARFQRINERGGIQNKKVRLISMNDDGNPVKAEENIKKLHAQGVSMFIGNMGTRSLLKVFPEIKAGKISMFFPWSGNPKLRNKDLTNIINGPGLMKPQANEIVRYIADNIKHKKVALFSADDAFSKQATSDLIQALKTQNIEPTITSYYNRHTLNIVKQADKIIETDPKIVICVSTSMPAVRLINRFFEQGSYATTFFGIDSTLFVPDIIKSKGAKFFYSSAVPNPFLKQSNLAKNYLDDMKKYFPNEIPNVLSFSYYISAAIVEYAMKKISETISQEKIIKEIESMKEHSIEGVPFSFDETNRHIFGKDVSIIKG